MRIQRGLACAALLVAPACAWAHGAIPGIGHFYSGLLHPLTEPAQGVALLALGLRMGQRGATHVGDAVLALILAVFLGLAATLLFSGVNTDTVLLAIGAAAALSVSADQLLPRWVLVGIAGLLGVAVGLGSGPEGLAGSSLWLSLAGTWIGVVLVPAWVAAMTSFAQRNWMKIAVRVMSSWVAASALVVLALTWIGPQRGASAGVNGPLQPASATPTR